MNCKYLRRLFQIVIRSSLWFQLSFGSELTIILYPELETDFVEYSLERGNNELPDPYSVEVVQDLQNACHEMQTARTFELMAPDQNQVNYNIDYARCEDITELNVVTYEAVTVTIGDFKTRVPLYPCYKHANFGYLYITPGFSKESKFLFKRADLNSNPVIYGLVEVTPLVDGLFHDQRHLEKYFVQAYRMYESESENEFKLTLLNGHQHFRLCSLVEEARREYAETSAEDRTTSRSTSKIQRMHQPGHALTYSVTFQQLDKLNPVYAHLEVQVTTLPCFTKNGKLEFLVSENPKDPEAVFVFERRVNHSSKKKEIFLVQHVRDIALLRNVDIFYKK